MSSDLLSWEILGFEKLPILGESYHSTATHRNGDVYHVKGLNVGRGFLEDCDLYTIKSFTVMTDVLFSYLTIH